MPCLQVTVNVDDDTYKKNGAAFVKSATEKLSKILGKPATYMMISLTQGLVAMGGEVNKPTSFVKLDYLGPLPKEQLTINKEISKCVTDDLKAFFTVDANKVFIVIQEQPRIGWGWNGDIPFYKPPANNAEKKEDK
eukprot:62253_1